MWGAVSVWAWFSLSGEMVAVKRFARLASYSILARAAILSRCRLLVFGVCCAAVLRGRRLSGVALLSVLKQSVCAHWVLDLCLCVVLMDLMLFF